VSRALAFAAAALALAACAPRSRPAVSVDELRGIADRFDRAQLTQDSGAMDRLMADDFILIGSNGVRQDKRQFIQGFTEPGVHFDVVTPSDRYFIPLGPDAGLVGGEAVLTGTDHGAPFRTRIRFSDTFRRVDGRWQAVHAEATRVAEPAAQ
jgi:hypothetical protein